MTSMCPKCGRALWWVRYNLVVACHCGGTLQRTRALANAVADTDQPK